MGSRKSFRKAPGFGRKLCRARNRRRGLFGAEALRPRDRVPIGRLELEPPLALLDCGLNLVGLRQRREQRLSLGDLRHLRRRRKAFQRRREDGVGLDETAC